MRPTDGRHNERRRALGPVVGDVPRRSELACSLGGAAMTISEAIALRRLRELETPPAKASVWGVCRICGAADIRVSNPRDDMTFGRLACCHCQPRGTNCIAWGLR